MCASGERRHVWLRRLGRAQGGRLLASARKSLARNRKSRTGVAAYDLTRRGGPWGPPTRLAQGRRLVPSNEIRECCGHAEEARREADAATDQPARENFLDIEREWLLLARIYEREAARKNREKGT